VGHPLPGISIKIVNYQTKKNLPIGQEGLIFIKGPNVMLGYLGAEDMTSEVINQGWYNTKDMGRIDEDGFLTITDRISRFSKIGGEMVPHMGIEDVYHSKLDTDERVLVVTGVPDEKKGEQLVVLYVDKAGSVDKLQDIISSSDIPAIWKPNPKNYFRIDELPVLGSGKIDMVRLKNLALQAKATRV